ncbi:MAG: condensation domain-containing protein, partial [Melioribacteraceae bacterium]|nr:condensation domain-containing protein [Melioribacteraceae bacterium]
MKNKNIEDFYPLTPLQAGMLFHTLAESEDGIYVEQFKCIISGEFNINAFKESWHYVVRNHQILRSSFIYENIKEPIQVVHRKVEICFNEINLEDIDEKAKKLQVKKILNNEITEGFDFSKPPLMKFVIIKLSEDKIQFAWTYHHILLDGWSIPLIINEIFVNYNKLTSNKNIVLEKTKQFKDYIVWLKRQDREKAERYWKEQLREFTNPTSLSFDIAQSSNKISIFDEKEIWVDKEKTSKILAFCKSQGITVNTIVQAAWAFLLGKYSGENDVLFGSTVSGRSPNIDGVENMVGMFINTLPVRVQLNPQSSVVEFLNKLQKTQLALREFEYSSLIDIHRMSDIPADKTMFDSIVVFENYPIKSIQDNINGKMSIEDADILEKTNFPINLIAGLSDRLFLKLVYDVNRFSSEIIERMLN